MNLNKFLSLILLAVWSCWNVAGASGQDAEAGKIRVIQLMSLEGKPVSVEPQEDQQWTVLCFTGVECPLAKLYAPRLVQLAAEFAEQNVRFIGLNSNQQDSAAEFAEFVTRNEIPFVCCKDLDNVIADRFEVTRTPEVIVLDHRLEVRYRGRVDDQYLPGISRAQPQRQDLRIALQELISGRAISVARTEPEGCLIGRVKTPVADAEVTYANQVSRILQANCVECHREGEIGPFVLNDYDEVVGWAEMIVETIEDGRMPPWHADPAYGTFLNERRISETEKQQLRQWVRDGAPFGDVSELPSQPEYVAGWRLPREPDVVIEMSQRAFSIPAEGTVEYQYFVVDPGFEQDRWVTAAQVVPGNRAVVHHSIVFIRPPDGSQFRGVGWLGAYVPGQQSLEPESHRARRIPAGSKLVFQQHYTPNGSPQTDITKIGLVFAEQSEVEEELITLLAMDQQFEIKPYEAEHPVEAALDWFPNNGKLLSVSPHMHFRGKSFVARIKKADEEQVLVNVPKYDFNWQHVYQFTQPISLADAKQINISVTFDNSEANPFNPAPEDWVRWGDQTSEEMAIGFFDVAIPRGQPTRRPGTAASAEKAVSPATQAKIVSFVDDFFDKFDVNGDGKIMKSELPLSMSNWAYRKWETDGKAGLSRAEIERQAKLRFRD